MKSTWFVFILQIWILNNLSSQLTLGIDLSTLLACQEATHFIHLATNTNAINVNEYCQPRNLIKIEGLFLDECICADGANAIEGPVKPENLNLACVIPVRLLNLHREQSPTPSSTLKSLSQNLVNAAASLFQDGIFLDTMKITILSYQSSGCATDAMLKCICLRTSMNLITLSGVPVLAEGKSSLGESPSNDNYEALESTTKRPNPIGIGLD